MFSFEKKQFFFTYFLKTNEIPLWRNNWKLIFVLFSKHNWIERNFQPFDALLFNYLTNSWKMFVFVMPPSIAPFNRSNTNYLFRKLFTTFTNIYLWCIVILWPLTSQSKWIPLLFQQQIRNHFCWYPNQFNHSS